MITPRTRMIVSQSISCDTAADIGTDHGFVPIELIRRGICRRCIACDIAPGPLSHARENIEESGYSRLIQTRLGSGLLPLKAGEAELIIIAGMGGENIQNILTEGEEIARGARRLIIQPMNNQYHLRRFLLAGGWGIVSEDLCCEGTKVYNLICVNPKEQTSLTYEREIDYHLPPSLYDHPDFPALVAKERRRFSKILAGRAHLPNDKTAEYCRSILKEIDNLCKQ